MSTDLTLTDSERLVLAALSEAFDSIVSDIIDSRTYGGPDAHMHAQNQAQRELSAALVALVKTKRDEPVPC